jgi:exosortase D (VPLPA-CTERM-specific)
MTAYDTSDMNIENPGRHGSNLAQALVYGAGCLLLFALLFHSTYQHLFVEWLGEDYNYCFFVPLIFLYLLWEKRTALRSVSAVPSWGGLIPLVLGIAFFWLGELGGEFYTIYFSSWLVLIGFVWTYTGWGKLKIAAKPLCFLITMFPFPKFITNNLTLELKLISSKLGVDLMQWCGLTAYREGNVIDLGFTRLQVVDACSGLRYFFPLIIMGMLLAYYYRAKLWKKVLLVFSAIPISVVTNGFRIASVGILYRFWGPAAAEGLFHDFSGWFIFMCSLGLLLLEMLILNKIFPSPVSEKMRTSALRGSENSSQPVPAASRALSATHRFLPVQFVVLAVLLIVSILLSHGVDFREKVPSSRPLDQFPLRISCWQGVRTTMEKVYLDELKFDDYVMVDYKDPHGKMVSFYTAYFGSQTKGGSIHSPASCLPGGGWIFEDSGDVTFPLKNGAGNMRVNRANMQKEGVRELTYYWFPQRGRNLTNLFQLKLFTFWNALTRRRTDGALVRVVTPVYESEQLIDADARLQGFTREITPVLATFLPK